MIFPYSVIFKYYKREWSRRAGNGGENGRSFNTYSDYDPVLFMTNLITGVLKERVAWRGEGRGDRREKRESVGGKKE